MIRKWQIDYPAYTGYEKRNAYVYLPAGYEQDTGRSYPVLYMFDGHNVFFDADATYGKSWGMREFLDRDRVPLIVASVECNHSPEGGRLSEYSPYDFVEKGLGYIKGRGEETMDWYIHVFKRYIDANFRTIPDRRHTFIGGSSMGGLMTLYGVLCYNQVFSRGMAMSPSLEIDIDQLCLMVRSASVSADTVLYMDYGDDEFNYYLNAKHDYQNLVKRLLDRRILLTDRIIPNGTHCEASWERQLPFGINTIMYGVDE